MLKPSWEKRRQQQTVTASWTSGQELRADEQRKINYFSMSKLILTVLGCIGLYVGMDLAQRHRSLLCKNGVLTSSLGSSSSFARTLCKVETELENGSFRNVFPERTTPFVADYTTDRPSGETNVAFVVTIPFCPEDESSSSWDDDPGLAFYDAAAVLRDSICNCTSTNPNSGSKYSHTMYAIIHPEATQCDGPPTSDGAPSYKYDRVKILEELGFWAVVWREPIYFTDLTSDKSGANVRDLMKLYAYNFTRHDVAIMTKLDTMFMEPIDAVVDTLKQDAILQSIYTKEGRTENNRIHSGALFLKPSFATFTALTESFQTTNYDEVTGWDGSGILGLDAEGILSHYFLGQNNNNGAVFLDATSTMSNTVQTFSIEPLCQKPWDCHYSSWDTETADTCRVLNNAWYHYRQSFEQNWTKTELFDTTTGLYHPDYFLGYCMEEGGYPRMADYADDTVSTPTPAPVVVNPPPTPAPVVNPPPTPAPIVLDPPTPAPVSSECDALSSTLPPSTTGTVLWTGEGADNDWFNTENWFTNFLPGTTAGISNRVVLALNDLVHVANCPTSAYMEGTIRVEMRSTALMDVSSDLIIGESLLMESPATLRHTSGLLDVQQWFQLDSLYEISGDASMTVGGLLDLKSNGSLKITAGSNAGVSANSLSWAGEISITLDENSAAPLVQVSGDASSVSGSQSLVVDASAYTGGGGTIDLITFSTVSSAGPILDQQDITVIEPSSAAGNYFTFVVVTDLAVSLVFSLTPPPTPFPTSSPTYSGHIVNDKVTFTFDTGSTITPTSVASNIVIMPDTAELEVDGSNFANNAGTFPLFQLQNSADVFVNQFDPNRIRFTNFPEGLWFEITYEALSITLHIKPVTDFSEYTWNYPINWETDYGTNWEYPIEDPASHALFDADHDWGTVPRWMSVRKASAYTDAELDIIAAGNYAFVKMIELDGVQGLRDRNCSSKIITYLNSVIYDPEDGDGFNEELWLLPDPGQGETRNMLYDHSVPAMRDWWVNRAISKGTHPLWDGIFIDALSSQDPNSLQNGMIEQLRSAFPKTSHIMMGNALRQMRKAGSRYLMPYFDGSYFENWQVGSQPLPEIVSATIQLGREALFKDKLVHFNSIPWNCGWPCLATEQQMLDGIDVPLAVFLIMVENNAYFNYLKSPKVHNAGQWEWDASGIPEMQMQLGPPLGPPVKIGTSVFARSFLYLNVKIDLATEEVTFTPVTPN